MSEPRAPGGAQALAWVSLAFAALILAGGLLTLISAYTVRGGHPPLAAVLWVGLILATLALAPFGAAVASFAVFLGRRSGNRSASAIVALGLHLALFALALYYRLR